MLNIKELSRINSFQLPRSAIGHVDWTCHGFALRLRYVEDLLMEPGIPISYKTIRDWVNRFGYLFAARFRRDRPAPADKWHIDEHVIRINGKTHSLWHADDANADMLVQPQRNRATANRSLREFLKCWGEPRVMVTDKLWTYGAANAEYTLGVEHRQAKGPNNRCKASHRYTRQQGETAKRFKSRKHAQRLQSTHGQTTCLFRTKRQHLSATSYRRAKNGDFNLWARHSPELAV